VKVLNFVTKSIIITEILIFVKGLVSVHTPYILINVIKWLQLQ